MLTPAQQRDYEIYCLTDLIAEQKGWDGPQRPQHENDLLSLAEAAWEAQQRGELKPWHVTVVPSQDDQGVWGFTAIVTGPHIPGCDHWVQAASWALARADAVTQHEHVCLPRGGPEVFNETPIEAVAPEEGA